MKPGTTIATYVAEEAPENREHYYTPVTCLAGTLWFRIAEVPETVDEDERLDYAEDHVLDGETLLNTLTIE